MVIETANVDKICLLPCEFMHMGTCVLCALCVCAVPVDSPGGLPWHGSVLALQRQQGAGEEASLLHGDRLTPAQLQQL